MEGRERNQEKRQMTVFEFELVWSRDEGRERRIFLISTPFLFAYLRGF